MKNFLLILVITVTATIANSQRRIALHHQGTVQIFSSPSAFQDAYNAASNGDTIYLPGGQFNAITIAKKLHIYGVGYHIDSTAATSYTYINGSITFSDGADGATLQGLYVGGSIGTTYDHKVDSLTIRRNYISGNVSFAGNFNSPEANKSTGIELYENIVNDIISCEFATNIHIHHNIFKRLFNIKENGWIHHNVLIEAQAHSMQNIFNSLFENNFINYGWWGFNSVSNNTFIKNVFDFNPTTDLNNSWIGSYISTSPTTLFVNPTTPYTFTQFPLADFHLNNPAAYLGSDGTQIGLFGSSKPFKQGGIPENPHIQFKNIAAQTDVNGNLSIQIKVAAQNE